mmetsp:Transcript_60109/g.119248  ORF Transcript_60109/g.119248 Transcript_60109/m.119248 type:complete len:128 (-) Transcript_60109:269-652(-)
MACLITVRHASMKTIASGRFPQGLSRIEAEMREVVTMLLEVDNETILSLNAVNRSQAKMLTLCFNAFFIRSRPLPLLAPTNQQKREGPAGFPIEHEHCGQAKLLWFFVSGDFVTGGSQGCLSVKRKR